jgi:glycosyltransferase involved in cell wall biosynthesis
LERAKILSIWVDAKNPLIYGSGISYWLHDLLEDLDYEIFEQLTLVVPNTSRTPIYPDLGLPERKLWWPKYASRKINQLFFDNYVFSLSAKKANPKLIFSPYFDVLMPKKIPSIITIHDLCYIEVMSVYPVLQRNYFNFQMRRNIKRAKKIVTVSQSSKNALVGLVGVPEDRIIVVENTLSSEFRTYQPTCGEIADFKNIIGPAAHLVLYTGGLENRKNIPNLLNAIRLINCQSQKIVLVVTGNQEKQWAKLMGSDSNLLASIHFTGYLSAADLKTAYLSCDAVVAPSISEGFGRSCLEAITSGTPLACSDIPVFREVAGEHGIYFDPKKSEGIASGIQSAIDQGRCQPVDLDTDKRQRQVRALEKILIDLSTQ